MQQTSLSYRGGDGRELRGDLVAPEPGERPVAAVLLVPGGGWRISQPQHLNHWAQWLASHGIAAFCIEYATAQSAPGGPFPLAIQDLWGAVRELQERAESLGIDRSRIGLVGESAGATVATLAALARTPVFLQTERSPPPEVVALAGIYGTYDMAARWRSQLQFNEPPGQGVCRGFLGVDLYDDPQRYFDASPLAHVSYGSCRSLQVMLAWGTDDPVVPAVRQSEAFAQALREARHPVVTCPIAGAGHFWFQTDPVEEPTSPNAILAPRLLRFLRGALASRG